MNTKLYIALLLCFTLFTGFAQSAKAENNVTVLENGLRVLVVEDNRFPLVSVRLYVNAGAAYENPEQAGLSHLLEHMVFHGTPTRPGDSLVYEIESVGGMFNAYTSADETVYFTELPSSEWRRGMDVVVDMAFNPTLDPEILEEEKRVVYAEMGQTGESPEDRMYDETLLNAFAGTPYMHGVLGTEETVTSISVEDMRAYMAQYYNPQNMLLVVVGDVQKNEVIQEAQTLFSHYENTTTQTFPSSIELPLYTEAQLRIAESPASKVLINITFPTIPHFNDAARAVDLFTMILGGMDTSFLVRKFEREHRLVNDISAYNYDYGRLGMIFISVDLEVEQVEEFWQEFVTTLANLSHEDFTEEQLETAKFFFTTYLQERKSTIGGYASLLGSMEFYYPGEFALDNYLHGIEQVELDDIQETITSWINPYNMSITVLAPEEVIENNQLPDFLEVVENEWTQNAEQSTIVHQSSEDFDFGEFNSAITERSEERVVLELAEGSTIILLPDDTMPFVSAELRLLGGDGLVSSEEQGLPFVVSYMLNESTESMDREEFSAYLSERYLFIFAEARRESFSVTLEAPTQYLEEGLEQFFAVIEEPAFDENDWNNAHPILIASARDMEESPDNLLYREMMPTLYSSDSPYGYRSNGTLENIENIELQQVRDLWEIQKAQPWILTVAGDFDFQAILDFAKLLPLNHNPITLLDAPQMNEERDREFTLEGSNHDYILQMFPTVPYTHEDAAALSVLEQVLGGMSGILFKEVREARGLAYSTYPIDASLPSTGFFALFANTAPENSELVVPAFDDVIEDLHNNLLSEELIKAAQVTLETSYIRGRQSLMSRINEVATNAFLGRDLDYNDGFMEQIQSITPQDVQDIARKYLISEQSYLLRVTSGE